MAPCRNPARLAFVGLAAAAAITAAGASSTEGQQQAFAAQQAGSGQQAVAASGQQAGSGMPMNVHQYTPAGYVSSVAPLMSRAWHAPSGFQTAHLANGMTMNVPIDLPSTAVYGPTGAAQGTGIGAVTGGLTTLPGAAVGTPGMHVGGVVAGRGMSALDPELAYVQQQQLAEKARIAQEIQALQYEAAMRARDVAMSNMGVHVAEQRLAHAQQLAHAVHSRLAAAQRQLAALDVAQRRAADQSQLNQLQAALAEASASEAALTGARAGHESLVKALKASVSAANSRVDAATGAIEDILAGQGTNPTKIHGAHGVTSDIAGAMHKQLDIAQTRAKAIEHFQKELSNSVPSASDLVTKAHEEITDAGEDARAKAASGKGDEEESGEEDDEEEGGDDGDEDESGGDAEDEEAFLQRDAVAHKAAATLRRAAGVIASRLRGSH